jgi:hypothetical protein
MPQPYRTKEILPILPHAPAMRPILAVHIAVITALWSNVELELGILLALLLGVHAEIGVGMYFAITSVPGRKAAMEAVAKQQMTEDGQKALVELYRIIGKAQGQRNDVVHGSWTAVERRPKALILCDTQEATVAHIKNMQQPKMNPLAAALMGIEPHKPRYLAYTERDFKNIEKDIDAALSEIRKFMFAAVVQYRPPQPAPLPGAPALLGFGKTTPAAGA